MEPNDRARSWTTIAIAGAGFMLVYYGSQWLFPTTTTPATTAETSETVVLSPEEQVRAAAEAEAREAERISHRVEGTIHTELFDATIDNLAGGVSHFLLLGDRFHTETGPAQDLVSTTSDAYRPLRVSLPGAPIPSDAVWDLRQVSEREVELRWRGEGLEVVRSFTAGQGPYQLYQTVVVRNIGGDTRRTPLHVHAFHYLERANEGSSMMGGRSPYMSEGLCRTDEDVERKDRSALLVPHGYGVDVDFVALESVYFVQALAATSEPAARCGLVATDRGDDPADPNGSLFEGILEYPTVEISPGGEHSWTTLAYLGPKDWRALGAAGHLLSDVVNLGTFAIIARAFAEALEWLFQHVGNWGLAIIILTLFVKLLLFPIVNRQYRMMAPMRRLKPEMDKISAEYKDDMEKRQAATMELYRRHGINPAAQMMGCLPVFLQMPVFFALYTSLSTNVELYHQPFIWPWVDLSARDPYFILPVLLSALMFVQQKLMPTTGMDPQQAKIMLYMMPLMMGMFMLFLPSGLCLYMLTNSALSIAQQQLNFWRASREDDARDAAAAAANKNTPPAEEKSSPKAGGRTGSTSSGRNRRG